MPRTGPYTLQRPIQRLEVDKERNLPARSRQLIRGALRFRYDGGKKVGRCRNSSKAWRLETVLTTSPPGLRPRLAFPYSPTKTATVAVRKGVDDRADHYCRSDGCLVRTRGVATISEQHGQRSFCSPRKVW